jgi:hypothetical protein
MFEPSVEVWVWVWLAAAAIVVLRHGRRGTVGLLITYVLSFAALHWLTAGLTLLPWYLGKFPDLTAEGLRQSTFATFALVVGAECGASIFKRLRRDDRAANGESSVAKIVPERLLNGYLTAGLVMYVVLTRVGVSLPTINALVNTGSTLMVVGVCLKCWNGWHGNRHSEMWRWIALTLMFPVLTVVAQGYIGYGFAAAVTVFAFFASFYRPVWKLVVIATLLTYIGISGYVTYMRDRKDIRAVVWARGDMSARLSTFSETVTRPEPFDPYNVDHLDRIESRLNQDYLIGAAVNQLTSEAVPYARGATLWDAMLGFVPRALWPDKPVVAGSGDLVSTYTGFVFGSETAVGIGQVLECYVNFGTLGVIVGFILIGAAIVVVDRSAYYWLCRGNVANFTLWYLPGLALLNVGGSFVELTSTWAAAFIVAVLAKRLVRQFGGQTTTSQVRQWPGTSPASQVMR